MLPGFKSLCAIPWAWMCQTFHHLSHPRPRAPRPPLSRRRSPVVCRGGSSGSTPSGCAATWTEIGASGSASLLEATPEVSVVPAPPSGSEVSVTPHAAASSDVPPSDASKVTTSARARVLERPQTPPRSTPDCIAPRRRARGGRASPLAQHARGGGGRDGPPIWSPFAPS